MNKIMSKEYAEAMRLDNVLRHLHGVRNNLVDQKRLAKKQKNLELLHSLVAKILKADADIINLTERVADAKRIARETALEMAVLRTKMYVLSYCLQGAVFDLKSFLQAHAHSDGGELHFCSQLADCSKLLMTMPVEFGEYGGSDNRSFNVCEEIISKQVDAGVRAAFEEMLKRELHKPITP